MVDPISTMRTINRFGGYLLVLVLFLNFVGVSSAITGIETGLSQLCTTARSLLAVGTMLMIILAAVVYAVGQILGAETRARASVWATAMMTGAVIGIIIYIVVPYIIGVIANKPLGATDPCQYRLS